MPYISPSSKHLKFKVLFEDSSTSMIHAHNFNNAAIIAKAQRLKSGKDDLIIGMWARNECDKKWDKVINGKVVISF